jgi:putative MATE family efflux protein
MKIPALFNDRKFYRDLFLLALPIMFQNLINTMVNLLDTIMVGRLGTVEIAAVGLGNQIFFLYELLLFGICSGGAIFTAQFWGKKDIAGIRKNMGLCLTFSLTAAVLFFLFSRLMPETLIGLYSRDEAVIETGAAYLKTVSPSFLPFAVSMVFGLTLRAVEKVRLAFVVAVIALFLSGILNYLFIFGAGPIPAMGVVGAARATLISRVVQAIILVAVSYAKKYVPAGSFRELFGFNRNYVRQFLPITLPVIINEILWSLGITLQHVIFARTSTDAVAAVNITNTVSMLTWVLFIGLGSSVSVLIGKKIGERNEEAAREYAAKIVHFVPLLAVGAAIVLFPISLLLPFVFNVNPETLSLAFQMFIILCCSYPFRAFNMCMVIGICRAGGDTVFCAVYDIVLMWIFTLPLMTLAGFVLGAPVWFLYFIIGVEAPLKALIGYWRFRSGKWLRNVTAGL